MRRTVKIELGTFATASVEANLGCDVLTGLQLAVTDYVRKLEVGAAPTSIPCLPAGTPPAESKRGFELPLDGSTLTTLRSEAAREGVSVSRLAAHAVFVYLAELDRLTPASAPVA